MTDGHEAYSGPPAAAGRTNAPAGSSSDRKSTRLNSSHLVISYAVFCLKKKKQQSDRAPARRAGKDPAHLSHFIPCCCRRELQEHRGFRVCRSFSRAVGLSGRKRLDLL